MGEFQRCKKIGVPVAIPRGGLRTVYLPSQRCEDRAVSIPRSGLRTDGWEVRLGKDELSPSHPVGSKHIQEGKGFKVVYEESPSHTVGLEPFCFDRREYESLKSPSHAVGSEHAIHLQEELKLLFYKSPSHTVGLELREVDDWLHLLIESPSHPVGSEQSMIMSLRESTYGHHPTQWA